MLPSFRAVSRRRVSVVVYGANTDVGKTVASCGLLQAGRRGDYTASYVKPVQTGPDTDEAWVTAHASGAAVTTLFRYRDPVSPHLAALREQRIVSDEQLAAAVGQAVREKSDEDLTLVETAGGVLSPAPSGTPQADVLARVFAPQKGPAARPSGLLVGDPRLGGISATLTAYESLCARGQRPAVVLFLGGADNAHAVEDRLKSARLSTDAQQHRTVVIVLPAIPDAPEPLDEWYADKTVRAAFSRVVRLLVDDRAFDKRHVWHPYTSLAKPGKVWKVASCAGCEITLDDGRVLTDGMASWWSAIHGYNVPGINAAIETQLKSMSHVMFGGLTHQPAIDLCRTLVDVSPQGLECVFLADSGSVSMEAALKMALQYWMAQGKRDKTTMVTISHGYHGDTLGAMSICDPVNSMHSMFRKLLTPHIFIDDLTCLRETLELHHHTVAAVVVEPVVQGAGGMRFYPAEWLQRARQLCTEYGVLLVFDEIATGFGRTGALFAADLAGVTPDIMCVGKALTGGYMTLAALLCTRHVGTTVSAGTAENPAASHLPFMHGPTFMGNPLACAAANASLSLLLDSPWQERVRNIGEKLKTGLAPCSTYDTVADVRVLGGIGVVELARPAVDPQELQAAFVAEGVWIRPFGKLVYLFPPFVVTDAQLDTLTGAICRVVKNVALHDS